MDFTKQIHQMISWNIFLFTLVSTFQRSACHPLKFHHLFSSGPSSDRSPTIGTRRLGELPRELGLQLGSCWILS